MRLINKTWIHSLGGKKTNLLPICPPMGSNFSPLSFLWATVSVRVWTPKQYINRSSALPAVWAVILAIRTCSFIRWWIFLVSPVSWYITLRMLVFPKRFPPEIPSALYNDKYILSPSRKIAVLQIKCQFISRRQEISLTEQEKYTLQTVYPLFWFYVCAGKNSNILQCSAAFHVEVNRGCMWRDLTNKNPRSDWLLFWAILDVSLHQLC